MRADSRNGRLSLTYTWKRADGRPMPTGRVLVNGGRGERVRIPLPTPFGGRFGDASTAGVRSARGVQFILTARIELVAPLHAALAPLLQFLFSPRDEVLAITPALTVLPMHDSAE